MQSVKRLQWRRSLKSGILATIIAVLCAPMAQGAPADSVAIAKRKEQKLAQIAAYQRELAAEKSPADSVLTLFNIFDLAEGVDKNTYGWNLYHTARRAGNVEVANDALRNIANYNNRFDSITAIALEEAKSMPPGDSTSETIAFIRILRNSNTARHASAEERQAKLQELLRDASAAPANDIYERVVRLNAICVYLSEVSEGELLADYLHRLGNLIEELPGDNHALRNAYYVWASMIYTQVGQGELAIQACLNLLHEIDQMDVRNAQIGRKHRDYNDNRYIIYTRLLENYENLDPSQVDLYYGKALEMCKKSSRAARTYGVAPLPDIYYAFYQKNYRRAFDLLDKCKEEAYLDARRLQLTRMYIGAATAVGEKEALLAAYPVYTRILEEELENRQRERYRELQVLYDVNSYRTENLRLKESEQKARKNMWRTVTIVCIVLVVALTVFMFTLLRANRRKARLANKLKVSNRNLKRESDQLREARDQLREARDKAQRDDSLKTDFINNMSHEVKTPLQAIQEYSTMLVENVDEDRKKYLSTFADRLLLNCDMVSTIVNDVLHLAEISNSQLNIKLLPHEVRPICEAAADAVHRRLAPGVKIHINGDPELIVNTDRHRLMQILVNLLANAAKFTEKGSIHLDYALTADSSQLVIKVTDTGIGIDPANAEIIFERFRKIDSSTPGIGVGLTIARTVARMMGGDLALDPAYNDGARFILTLPAD